MLHRFATTLIACSLVPVSLGCDLVREGTPATTTQKSTSDTSTQQAVSNTTAESTSGRGSGSTTTYSRTIISDGRGNVKITYSENGKTVVYSSQGGEERAISQEAAVGKATSLRVNTSYGTVDLTPSGDADHVHVTATVSISDGIIAFPTLFDAVQ